MQNTIASEQANSAAQPTEDASASTATDSWSDWQGPIIAASVVLGAVAIGAAFWYRSRK